GSGLSKRARGAFAAFGRDGGADNALIASEERRGHQARTGRTSRRSAARSGAAPARDDVRRRRGESARRSATTGALYEPALWDIASSRPSPPSWSPRPTRAVTGANAQRREAAGQSSEVVLPSS